MSTQLTHLSCDRLLSYSRTIPRHPLPVVYLFLGQNKN